jgi:hypothetical protein
MAPSNIVSDMLASRSLHVAEPLTGVIFSVILVLASITVISGFLSPYLAFLPPSLRGEASR